MTFFGLISSLIFAYGLNFSKLSFYTLENEANNTFYFSCPFYRNDIYAHWKFYVDIVKPCDRPYYCSKLPLFLRMEEFIVPFSADIGSGMFCFGQ